MPRRLAPLFTISAVALLASPALAQQDQPSPSEPPAQPQTPPSTPITSRYSAPAPGEYHFSLTPRGEFAFASDLKETPGRVSVGRFGLDMEFNYSVSEQLGLSLAVNPEASFYSFSNATGLIPGTDDPFNDLYRLDIVPAFRYAIDRDWAVVGGGLVELAGEAEADIGKSATYGGYGGVRYRFSDKFSTTFGLVGKSRLEENAIFLPLFGLDWQITDQLTLSNSATGLKLTDKLNDQWSVWLAGAWELREYRLEDNGPLPEGIVRDRRVPVKVGVDWTPCPSATVTLEGGAIVYQRFNIDDRNGDRVSEDNTQAAPYIGLSVHLRF